MAKVSQKTLEKDIELIKAARTKEEVDKILAKYDGAIQEMEEKPAKKAPAKKAAAKKEEAPKKEPAKKTAAKKAEPKKEEPKKEEPAKEEAPKKTAAKKTTAKKAAEPKEEKPAAKKAPAKKAATATATAAAATAAPKGRQYNGKYEVFQAGDGWAYHLKASNGEILITSEVYATKDGVLKAIDAVKKNVEVGEITVFSDKQNHHKFKLTAKNHRVLCISANYNVEKSAIRASESFQKFALKADVVEVEEEDTDAHNATPIEITSRKENKSGGKFTIEKYNGEFSWSLKASNGQILVQGQGYTSKASVQNAIESFKNNVAEGTFKCIKDKNDRFLFKLYTPAGRVCAIGESYPAKASAEGAANSVVSLYRKAEIEEIEE